MSRATCRPTTAVVLVLLVTAAALVLAQAGMSLVQVVPDDLKFVTSPNGTLQAPVVGDATKPGLYAVRTKIPAGLRIQPHFHPDERIVLVLSGTLYVGFGGQFDAASMRPLPAGSVFTEPGKQPHFTWAKDGDVFLHVVGNGPTGTSQISQSK